MPLPFRAFIRFVHRAANRAVLTDAAGLVRNLTAADSLAAAAAAEAELLRGQLAVALQLQVGQGAMLSWCVRGLSVCGGWGMFGNVGHVWGAG